jgi:hypothetical protein
MKFCLTFMCLTSTPLEQICRKALGAKGSVYRDMAGPGLPYSSGAGIS